ncbi:ATP-binding protein [Rhizobium sp. BK376]|uniref:ATP-binding protein n=1 Tax=Rhizobium sp. BK376 TaxID=2512149 RepID=UPI00105172F7|nr:ATP-binding protein [Rhizobium sp. BK376]TCR91180.1 PAS/PAC sensor signal transduction histidine kinase [Rhizobium sp. BK376]
MPAIQYPFIDIAVHPRVRERFARGEAMVLFSTGLDRVLWANGAGADLFGYSAIYDFLEQGARPGDVSFRQIAATAHQLASVGDNRNFLIRMASGFRRTVVNAAVEMIRVQSGEDAVLFSAPVSTQPLSAAESARRMLDGFDDADTHMAVIGREGDVIAASSHFKALDITPQTARMLINMAGAQPDRLIKRPIPTGQGYLPAALGKLSEIPALNLLFVVETVIGHLDPVENFEPEEEAGAPQAVTAAAAVESATALEDATEETMPVVEQRVPTLETVPHPAERAADGQFADVLDAVADIEETADDVALDAEAPDESDASLEDVDALAVVDGATVEDIEAAGRYEVTDVSGETEEPKLEQTQTAFDETNARAETHDEALPEAEPAAPAVDTASVSEQLFGQSEPTEETTRPEESHVAETAHAASPVEPVVEHAAIEAAANEPKQQEIQAAAAETAAPDGPQAFAYKPNGRATRFVWKIDAEGRFSEVSHEFADAVGPHATNVTGVAFTDIAALFNLDPDGKIAELLARRDTWSGRTIYWPIEGTSLMVPVDLAALPTYTRSREFDGFRGFGVVRLSDAIEDPSRLGLTLAPASDEAKQAEETQSEAGEPSENEVAPIFDAIEPETDRSDEAVEPVAGHGIDVAQSEAESEQLETHQDEEIADHAAAEELETDNPELEFPPLSEPPALKISDSPNRRLSDKIVRLHEHRLNIRDGLSASEQAAFNEIARQLQPFGQRSEQATEAAEAEPAANIADEALAGDAGRQNIPADQEAQTEAPRESESMAEAETAAEQEQSVAAPESVAVAVESDNDNQEPAADEQDGERTSAAVSEPEEDFNPLDVLSTAIPPRVKMTSGLSADTVDQMPVALLVHAGDKLMHANPELLRLTGYESLADIERVGGLDALLQRHDLEGKTERPGTMMVVRSDDALIPVTARLQSIRWEDGSALMLALMPVEKDEGRDETPADIREEARPERMLEKVAKLQVEVEELQSILETATDGVVIIGPEGEMRSMNRSASALFNYDDQETRGKPFVMLFAHESQKAVLDYLSGLSGHGVASVLNDGREVIGREASGGFVPLFMTMGRLTSSNGYCAVIRDITQWKRTEEELRNAKRAAETANAHKSDFLARVSHEIRTPLNAIIGFSDMMAGERFGPIGHSRYIEYANDIGRSGRHVLDIVNDLLDISKIEAGEMDLEFGAVGLNEAISEAVSLVQPQANSQRVIIRTALSQSVPNVVADLRSIKQIALNILSNAIRFTPSGGQIVVSTSYEPSGTVVMRIRDTGVGMTRTELEQAMKPFRQVSTNSRQRGDGTGLGLPLTKAMVDANRAIFSINSAPNEGTLVEITFPSPRVLAN